MSTRLAVLAATAAAALAAAVAGGLMLRRRPDPDLENAVRRFGRAAARNVADDWDSLFI